MVGMSHFVSKRIENTLQIYAKNGLVPNFSGKNAANGQKKRKKRGPASFLCRPSVLLDWKILDLALDAFLAVFDDD